MVIRQVFTQVKLMNNSNSSPSTIGTIEVPADDSGTVSKKACVTSTYQGDKGISLTKSLKRTLNKHLPNNMKTQVRFTGQNLSTRFNVKDRTKFEYRHDVVYFGKCPEQNCTDNYLNEYFRRIFKRIIDDGGSDQNSHLFRHAVVNGHCNASCDDFKIIGSSFRNHTIKRKFAEAPLIKGLRPTFKAQEKSVELKLFKLFL